MSDNTDGAAYTVVQLLPSATRGEVVNVGVVAADASRARCELLTNWRRAQKFSGGTLAGVRLILDRLSERAETLTLDALRELTERDHGAIQFSPLRQSTLPVDRLASEMARLYLVDVRNAGSTLRGRSEAKAMVKIHARNALMRVGVEELAAEHLLGSTIAGEVDEHAFDAVIGNGKKTGFIHGLSFEEGEPGTLLSYAEAVAYRVSDVLSRQPAVGAGVLTLEPKRDMTPNYSKMLVSYEKAQRALTSVNATLLSEQTVNPWLQSVAQRAAGALSA